MPYYAKSEDWLHQSALLLQARPSTTRITTRYHLKPARRVPKPKKASTGETDADTTATTSQPPKPTPAAAAAGAAAEADSKPPRGHLVLKTYDPHSGVALKYKTSKAAEVGRLVQMLGTLGRGMAGLAAIATEPVGGAGGGEDEVMADAPGAGAGGEGESGGLTPVGGAGAGGKEQQQQQGGGGGGKKKKKGKK